MQTLFHIPVPAAPGTPAGAITLRKKGEEYIVHWFNAEDKGHHNGGYHACLSDALEDLAIRTLREERYHGPLQIKAGEPV